MGIRRDRNGCFAAALIAGSFGCFVLGLMTTGAVISPALKDFLNWTDPVGPLSGKVGMAILLWAASWFFLHWRWQKKEVSFPLISKASILLFLLGLLLTFPPFFEYLERH